MNIEVHLDEHLARAGGKSYYWLAKETGISHNTLHRLKKGLSEGITFGTLANICAALDVSPGDVLVLSDAKKKRRAVKK
jgi:putative transcriptional regulator